MSSRGTKKKRIKLFKQQVEGIKNMRNIMAGTKQMIMPNFEAIKNIKPGGTYIKFEQPQIYLSGTI